MKIKRQCPYCKANLIVYEVGMSNGVGSKTQEDAYCKKCGEIVYSSMSDNPLETRLYEGDAE